MVYRQVDTEGSETANRGTDEQERHTEAGSGDLSEHIFTKFATNKLHPVDVAGITGRNTLLPGEVSESRDDLEKSAEVVVVDSNEPSPEGPGRRSHKPTKDRTLSGSKCCKDFSDVKVVSELLISLVISGAGEKTKRREND